MLVIGHLKTPCGRVVQRQYRDVTACDYYHLSRTERDLAGRPSCKTAGGRTVHGGGGIYPDIVFPEPDPAPLWLERVREADLLLQWVGGYLAAHPQAFTTPAALATNPTLPTTDLSDFRAFAARQGVTVPAGTDEDNRLQRMLVLGIAAAKWGDEGFYRVAAPLDPEVRAAIQEFGKAQSILGPTR